MTDPVDEAIKRLKEWQKLCELDNGIINLVSGGSMEEVNRYYIDMEARRTEQQRANEITQRLARENYNTARVKAMRIIKAAQRHPDFPTFGIPDYEGEWSIFRAPDRKTARKYLQVINNSLWYAKQRLMKTSDIKPYLRKMAIA